MVAVVPTALAAGQSHGGASHALGGSGSSAALLWFLHGELLNGGIQTFVSSGITPSAPADQETAVAVQVVVRAPPAGRPAAVTSPRLVPRVAAFAALSRLAPPGRARLVA